MITLLGFIMYLDEAWRWPQVFIPGFTPPVPPNGGSEYEAWPLSGHAQHICIQILTQLGCGLFVCKCCIYATMLEHV